MPPVPGTPPSDAASAAADFTNSGFTASSRLVPVEKIAENQPFRVLSRALPGLREDISGPRTERRIDFRPEIKGDWTLVRHGKKLYLRGWISGPVRREEIAGKNLTVGGSPDDPQMGYRPTKITLSLANGFSIMGSLERDQFLVSQAVLDKHAWESW